MAVSLRPPRKIVSFYVSRCALPRFENPRYHPQMRFIPFMLSAAALAACGPTMTSARPEELTRRAAFDLDCPEPSLKQTQLGEGTYGVSGCGRRATYVSMCNGQPGNLAPLASG
jgi:hypothetical protein